MKITLLKAKLHQARLTHTELEYEGSCAIDSNLLDAAGIIDNEQIHIFNMNNGERIITYALRGEAGSGIISLNGAAAHKGQPGDRVIICSFATLPVNMAKQFKPTVIHLGEKNKILPQHNAQAN